MTRKVTFLFGAGASADAGLPISVSLTQEIAAYLDRTGMGRSTRTGVALNAAIGALVAYDTARGASAYAGVDVERLFSAAQMLASRDNLEVSPFVGSWNDSVINAAESRMPSGWGSDALRAIGVESNGVPGIRRMSTPSPDGYRLENLVQKAIVSVTGSVDSGSIYQSLQIAMMEALRDCLRIDRGKDLSYLSPAFSLPKPVRIATLNYDQAVEHAAAQDGVALTTGAKEWRGGFTWQWPEGVDIHLLKLHGSINWRIVHHDRLDEQELRDEGELAGPTVVEEESDSRYSRFNKPGIIFGQRGKLRADGPFLAML